MNKGLSGFFVQDKKVKTEEAGAAKAPVSDIQVREKREEEIDILDTILSGKELVTTIDTDYGEFQFRYPDGEDQLRIAHRKAGYLGGFPDSSFDAHRRVQFEQWATLDILISGKPEKYEKLSSWADFPDQYLVEDLYTRGAQFCREIRDKISEARSKKAVARGKPAGS
jgi:hypothetical protein